MNGYETFITNLVSEKISKDIDNEMFNILLKYVERTVEYKIAKYKMDCKKRGSRPSDVEVVKIILDNEDR